MSKCSFYILLFQLFKNSHIQSCILLVVSFRGSKQNPKKRSPQKEFLQQLVNNLVMLSPQQVCLLLCHLFNIPPSQRQKEMQQYVFKATICLHAVPSFLYFCTQLAFISGTERLLASYERECGCGDGKQIRHGGTTHRR